MSHGAAGFAYALSALAAATGRDDFAMAAAECLAFENSSYDAARHNWPDLRGETPLWPCQWCHGAAGIGLARVATARRQGDNAARDEKFLATDIRHALEGASAASPMPVDTLCCGTLGNVEFFCEAAAALDRADLARACRAATQGDGRTRGRNRRLPLEQRQAAIQSWVCSAASPASATRCCGKHRRQPAQRADLGIGSLAKRPLFRLCARARGVDRRLEHVEGLQRQLAWCSSHRLRR